MAEHERYLSVGELHEELPFDPSAFGLSDAEYDELLRRLLDEESERVEAWADTRFTPTDATATLSHSAHIPRHDLPLPKRPIQSVTSVTADGTALTEGDDYVVHDTHLELLADPVADIDAWPTARRSIEVDWTYGTAEAPGEVRDGIVRLVRSRLERIQSDGLESESLPTGQSGTYRPPEAILAAVQGAIQSHGAPSYHGGAQVI